MCPNVGSIASTHVCVQGLVDCLYSVCCLVEGVESLKHVDELAGRALYVMHTCRMKVGETQQQRLQEVVSGNGPSLCMLLDLDASAIDACIDGYR